MPGPGTAADTHASSLSVCSWARPCISQNVDAAAPAGVNKLRWLSLSPTGRWPPFLQSRAWRSWGRTCWVGTRSEAPQQMPGPGTAADTHASSSSVCSWARPCISQYVDAADPTGQHKLRWLSLSSNRLTTIPAVRGLAWEPDQKHPQEMPGPGTAADTHASSSSFCSWARPCISQYVDAADPTGQHKLRWLSSSSNRLTTIPAVRGLAWEPDQKHPKRCQGLAQLQTLTLAARVSAVEPGPASANMLTQQTLQDNTSSGG